MGGKEDLRYLKLIFVTRNYFNGINLSSEIHELKTSRNLRDLFSRIFENDLFQRFREDLFSIYFLLLSPNFDSFQSIGAIFNFERMWLLSIYGRKGMEKEFMADFTRIPD